MVGLELRDADALAVVVDNDGKVIARGRGTGRNLGDAALAALGQLPASAMEPPSVVSVHPESPAVGAAMQVLATKFDTLARLTPVASGTAAASAEAWVGAARGRSDVVYFSAAEHPTAGILYGSRPLTGVNRRAPAVAWLALNPVEREDYRKTGCLDAEVGAAGIVRRLIWRIKAGDRSRVQDAVKDDLAAIHFDHIVQAARGGDGVSISVMRDTAKYLGMAAANLVVIADPEVLVLGGIMASAPDLMLDAVKVEIGRRLPPPMAEALTIAPALLGDDAPAIGATRAAAAALQ
jgi:predicted NBD/HSP70 family sugar kinase